MATSPALTIVPTALASTSGSITFDRGIGKIQWNRSVIAGTEVLKIYTTNSPTRTTTLATINYSDAAAHYTYTTKLGTTFATRILNFGWFISSSASVDSYVNFASLPSGSYITISFDIKGYIISNLTIVLGQTEYTWNLIYDPIAIVYDMNSSWSGVDPGTYAILASNDGWSTWYNAGNGYYTRWELSDYPSLTYVVKLAVRYADLTGASETESDI